MTAPTYRFPEFVDVLLDKLYDTDREQQDSQFVDLDALVGRQINGEVPSGWVFDAAKVLQGRRLVDCRFNSKGTYARLTGAGRVYVQKGSGITRITQGSPHNYYSINISGNNSQVVTGSNSGTVTQSIIIEQERAPAFHALDAIEQRLNNDPSLTNENRVDAMKYTKLVRQELTKNEPDRNQLAKILDNLGKITSIATHVASFMKLINA